ncbi:MAG: MarR family winged helix-turn-helix transcriptional regulator [Bdellovibrionota bacterium]
MLDKEVTEIRKNLRKIVRGYGVFDEMTWTNLGISYAQSQVLFEISENPGVSAKQVAEALRIDKSTVSRLVKKLIQAKLIAYEVRPNDARCKEISVTTAGKKVIRKLDQLGNDSTHQAIRGLNKKEINNVLWAFKVLSENLNEEKK